jgi:hypothetical protein
MKKAFINSLPKSGTNLLAKCLELLGYQKMSGFASSTVLHNKLKSKFRRYLWSPIRHGYLIGIDSPVEIARWAIDRRIAACREGTFLFGHVGYTVDLMDQLIRNGFSMLVMLRDPRAVLNSFVHYININTKHSLFTTFKKMNVEERFLSTLRGLSTPKITLQPLHIRCRALDPWVKSVQVLNVRFEDLIGEKGGSTQIAQRHTIERIAKHLEAPTFNIQKVIEELFGSGRGTFRKGKVDSWRTETPKKIIPIINKELEDILAFWGYQKDE